MKTDLRDVYRTRLLGCTALLFAACGWSPAAQAADAEAAAPQAEPAASVEDIIVTARRRDESLQKVPVAVTAVTPETLRERTINQATDLVSSVPSLQVQPGLEGRQATRFYIRGQGVGFGGAPPSVVSYFAEVPLDPNGGGTFALNDLELVQVLRGPQGTLFGRNANGGAVVLTPKAPGDKIEGFVDGTYGNYDYFQLKAGITLPIAPTLSVRVSGSIARRHGYTKNISGKDFDNLNDQSWRIYLRWKPSDTFQDDLIYNGQIGKSNGLGTIIDAARPNSAATLFYPLPGLPLVTGTGLGNDLIAQQGYGPRKIDVPATYFGEKSTIHLITNTAKLDIGSVTLKNITGFESVTACPSLPVTATRTNFFVSTCFENYLNTNAGIPVHPTVEQRQITNETNISGTSLDSRLNWIAGAFFLWSDPTSGLGTFYSTRAAKSLFVANVTSALQRDRSQAVYGQATYALTDTLKVTGGMRYTWDQRALQFGQVVSRANGAPGTFACASPGLAAATPTASCLNIYKDNFSDYGYTADIDWQATSNLLLYVTTRKGYKSGGFNSTSTSTLPEYQPETLKDVEVGGKLRWGSGSVRGTLNIDYFHGWYSGIQQQLSIVNAGQATVITTNAGKALLDGVEVEANANLGDLNISANYSHINARYKKCPANPTPAQCFLDSGVDVTSSIFLNTPKDTLSVTGRYTVPLGEPGNLVGQVSYYTRSKIAYAADNILNSEAIAPGYQVVNLRLEWNNIFGRSVSMAGFVNNVFDRAYIASGVGLGGLIGTDSRIYGEPRMYGVNATWRF